MDGMLAAVDTLRARVLGSFGPAGEEVLVFAPPDAPLITADGHAILRAVKAQRVSADDPRSATMSFERVVLDAAEGVYRETGDGTTQFVLLLHGVLTHLVDHSGGSGRLGTAERVRAVRALGRVRCDWDSGRLCGGIYSRVVVEEAVAPEQGSDGVTAPSALVLERAVQILTTALTGVLGRSAVCVIVQLVMQWVFSNLPSHTSGDPIASIYCHLQSYLRQAPRAILHAQGGSFAASHVVSPRDFVLRKSLIPSQLPSLVSNMTPLRFVCFTGSLDLVAGGNHIHFEAASGQQAMHALDGVRYRVVQFLTILRTRHHVHLIVVTQKVEDYIAAACNRLRLACVEYAEEDDVAALCSIATIFPLTSAIEQVQENLNVGVCEDGVSVVRHTQTPSLYFRCIRSRNSMIMQKIVPQLAIYASSKGVYRQYYNAILKSLRVLHCLFASDTGERPCLRVCRGAGATELAIAHALHQEDLQMAQDGISDVATRLVKQSLSTALVESVMKLHANLLQGGGATSETSAHRKSRRVLLDDMSRANGIGAVPMCGYVVDFDHSIETKLGSICVPTVVREDPLAFTVIHPWRRLDTIIHSVLQTAEMLLRVDAIVYMKSNPSIRTERLHEAADQDEEE